MLEPRTKRYLGLLLVVALVLRLGSVALLGGVSPQGPLTYEHGEIAKHLLAGDGFSVKFLGATGPTSQQAPLYPALLALLYSICGQTTAALITLQVLQCFAGTGVVLAVAYLGWALLPERREIGWAAAWGAALYPPHLYMVTHVQVATWATLLLTTALALAVSPSLGRWRSATWAGLCTGLLLLVEPILVLAVPIIAVLHRGAQPKRTAAVLSKRVALGPAVWLVALAGLLTVPWVVRNYCVHGEFVFVKSTFGYAFWQGNNELSWGTDKVPRPIAAEVRTAHDGTLSDMNRALWDARHKTLYIDDVALTPADYAHLSTRSEPERSRELGRRAWAYVCEHPGAYVQRSLRRLQYLLLFDETNPKAAHPLYRASTILWLVLVTIGLMTLPGKDWRRLWPLAALFAAVTLFHSLTIVSARFRLPLEPLAFLWAAQTVAPPVLRLRHALRLTLAKTTDTASPRGAHPLAGPHFTRPTASQKNRVKTDLDSDVLR